MTSLMGKGFENAESESFFSRRILIGQGGFNLFYSTISKFIPIAEVILIRSVSR